MQIDRSNYEIWFMDWLDGNLAGKEIEQLKLFLDQNPDLREEFNDLAPVSLVSPGHSFHNRESLKRSFADISEAQFAYLCAAWLEKDLNKEQIEELQEIISQDPERKRTFDLIRKTRLFPEHVIYKHKKRLLRPAKFRKIVRLSVTGLTAAAAVLLVILSLPVRPVPSSLKAGSQAQAGRVQSQVSSPSSATPAIHNAEAARPPAPGLKTRQILSVTGPVDNMTGNYGINKAATDTSAVRSSGQEIIVPKVPLAITISIIPGTAGEELIARGPALNEVQEADEGSRVGKFISKTFREKLLREKKPSEGPIKGFEIAEAGVNGLNRLFGWQMALDRKSDENGQPESLYFRSKVLTINAPVKKKEPRQ